MFTRKFTVPEYNFEFEMYELTIGEEKQITEAFDKRDPEFAAIMVPLIVSWNCTDRQGVPLPVNAEGLAKIPRPVIYSLIKTLLKSGYEEADS